MIDPSRRNLIARILKDIRLGVIESTRYPLGTVAVDEWRLVFWLERKLKLNYVDDATFKTFIGEMFQSNIVLFRVPFELSRNSALIDGPSTFKGWCIIPSVVFETEVMDLITSGKREVARTEVKPEVILKLIVPPRYNVKPSREVLEGIIADVLNSLGFTVRTNVKLPSRVGAPVEVDVWGERRIDDIKFTVHVSCKNWDRDVDKSVVDEEYGKVHNLREIPHLRILVARKLTDPARETALADGFIVLELGEKASAETAEEIYKLVYTKLRELFTGIALPELQKLTSEAKDIIENLRKVTETLERISTPY